MWCVCEMFTMYFQNKLIQHHRMIMGLSEFTGIYVQIPTRRIVVCCAQMLGLTVILKLWLQGQITKIVALF